MTLGRMQVKKKKLFTFSHCYPEFTKLYMLVVVNTQYAMYTYCRSL